MKRLEGSQNKLVLNAKLSCRLMQIIKNVSDIGRVYIVCENLSCGASDAL